MNGLLDEVVLTRADRRGRHARPVGERTHIVLRGGTSLLQRNTVRGRRPRSRLRSFHIQMRETQSNGFVYPSRFARRFHCRQLPPVATALGP
jgi:hypothetical protein